MKNTETVIRFVAHLGAGIDKSLADGKFQISDAANFFGLLTEIGPLVTSIPQLSTEWKAATKEDKLALVKTFAEEFELTNKKAEILIEKGLVLGVAIYEYSKLFSKVEAKEVAPAVEAKEEAK